MFRWETDLQSSFLNTATAEVWSPSAKFDSEQILEECSWSDGRADAVWAGITGELPSCGKTAEVLGDTVASRIVAELRTRAPRTEKRLFAASGVTWPTFRSALWQAINTGLVHQTVRGSYVLAKSFPDASVELCAFEFKLKDWHRAFYQALRYRSFAHRVYIVMPSTMTERAVEQTGRFRLFGIGLIEHHIDGDSRRLILARKQRPRSWPSYMRAIATLTDPDL